jgi:DNA-binding NarL/FixJ family response regulator
MSMRPVLALVAIRPGSLQDSLVALVTTLHQVNTVLIAEDAASALRAMAKHRPALVLLETSIHAEDGQSALRQIKTKWPATRCIALADDVHEQDEAEASGADVVLLKGYPAAELIAAVERLLA